MRIEIDSDVQAVAEFMQRNVPATRLVAVANGVQALAPILWAAYTPAAVEVLTLVASNAQIKQSETSPLAAIGSEHSPGCADGGSVAVTGEA